MRLTKKGDLALSTNAIVVLIIAVIILGLIITFITQGFGTVNDRFLNEVESLPEPPAASGSRPITLSPTSIRVGPGEQFGMKIRVMNVGEGPLEDFTPTITCARENLIGEDEDNTMIAQDILVRENGIFTYYGYVDETADSKQYLCQVTAEMEGTNKVLDFQIVVVD